ncbi:MAG: hypothetical protein ACYS91_11170 [Planctomycetota bacterium]
MFFWIPGIIHPIVVNSHLADERTGKIVEAIKIQHT